MGFAGYLPASRRVTRAKSIMRSAHRRWSGWHAGNFAEALPKQPRTGPDRSVLERRELPIGRTNLFARQSAAARAASGKTYKAPPAGALGYHAGAEFYLRPSQSPNPRP